jgi:hypothetical protein
MQRKHDEWLMDFQALLFSGYFHGEPDAAGKYRAMENANVKLKALLRAFMNDVQSDKPNGEKT